jgi:dTDP-4-dehydrorhamnose reductase
MIAISGAGTPLGKTILSAVADNTGVLQLDINSNTEKGFFVDFFKTEKPSVFINLSQLHNIDEMEYNPETAYNLHSFRVSESARAAKEYNCLYVLLSSVYIFNGKNINPYTEDDNPDPVSAYGDSLLLGENFLINSGCRHLIIRTGDLFGNECGIPSMRFLKKETGNRIKIIKDMNVSPSYIPDTAQAVLNLINMNASGIFNVCNSGSINACEFIKSAHEIIRERGDGNFPDLIETDIREMRFVARRPLNASLDIKKYTSQTGKELRTWGEALREYIELNNIKEI